LNLSQREKLAGVQILGGVILAEAFQPKGDLIASSREKEKYLGDFINF